MDNEDYHLSFAPEILIEASAELVQKQAYQLKVAAIQRWTLFALDVSEQVSFILFLQFVKTYQGAPTIVNAAQ